MGARRPVAMGLLFGFMVALWRNYLDAREIRHRIAATTTTAADLGAGGGSGFGRGFGTDDRVPNADPTPAVTEASFAASDPTNPRELRNRQTTTPKPKPKSRIASAITPPAVRTVSLSYPDPFAKPLRTGCEPEPPDPSLPGPRRLDWIADPLATADADWPVNCGGHETLCDVLRKTAIDREVLAAVADSHAPGVYEFVDGIRRLGVDNFLIIALDDAIHKRLTDTGVASYRVANDAQGSHKISAQKFRIIQEFVERGCSVLLTDTDVAWMRNPFPFLYRDADVESMSDGWDNSSAHGFLDTVDDPSMGPDGRKRARAFRVAALNSGMWYVSATEASRRLMAIMAHRMATEDKLWDQAGYNLELWFASRDAHGTAGATVRVMDPLCFVNSKVMFRFIRHNQPALSKENHQPVAMHANYHTDKAQKMKLVYQYYTNGAGIDVLNCDVGCGPDLKTTHELESKVQHSINDGIVGSKKWTDATEGMWAARPDGPPNGSKRPGDDPSHCAPPTPWNGEVPGVDRASTLHVVKKGRGGECGAGVPAGDEDEFAAATGAVCGALADVDPNAPELILVAVGDDANEEAAFEALLRDGVTRLGLKGRVLVATTSSRASSAALAAGVKSVALVASNDGARPSRPSKSARLSSTALKWLAARLVLSQGWPTLLLDPRTALIRDPSRYFSRDSDVEVASDGWDDVTAYGYDNVVDDPEMDWSRFCHGGRVLTSDPGFALLMPTEESAKLAGLVFGRVVAEAARVSPERLRSDLSDAAEGAADADFEHLAFNEALFLPSHGAYVSPGVTRRTLNYMCFANSKHVFRFLRKDRRFKDRAEHAPVAVRLSYHPNEPGRLTDVYAYYLKGTSGALNGWGDGVGRVKGGDAGGAGSKACAQSGSLRPGQGTDEARNSELASRLATNPNWSWGGVTPFVFEPGGALSTPWGPGEWGFVPAPDGPGKVIAKFVGTPHVLSFETAGEGAGAVRNGMFVSERCTDGDMIVGRIYAELTDEDRKKLASARGG
mmetsp:Transcript_9978/g.45167  ORF Transcript_9978/g.45167 Transcript_9978/m.45167 type:complete len:1011 (+) Transcript_9978:321-3353(+)